MPKRVGALAKVESIGRSVIKELEEKIRLLEGELEGATTQLGHWRTALGLGVKRRRGRPPGSRSNKTKVPRTAKTKVRRKAAGPSIGWDKVLAKLPPKFSMDQLVKRTPQLKRNPQARYIALARWTRAKLIRKRAAGSYEKAPKKSA
jgi:hypothetical protein